MFDFLIGICRTLGLAGSPEPEEQQPPPSPPPGNPVPRSESEQRSGVRRDKWVIDQRGRPGAPLASESEVWQLNEHGLTIGRCDARYITESGRVASAEELRAVCQFLGCAGYESEVITCFTCGLTFCARHAKVLEINGETRTFCDIHLEEELKKFDLWKEADRARGLPPPIPKEPPKPRAPASFRSRLYAQTKPSIVAPLPGPQENPGSGRVG